MKLTEKIFNMKKIFGFLFFAIILNLGFTENQNTDELNFEETDPTQKLNSTEANLQEINSSEELLEKTASIVFSIRQGAACAVDAELRRLVKKTGTKKQQPQSAAIAHKFLGGVTEIVSGGSTMSSSVFFVAGNDGFVSRYSYPKLNVDTWQLSSIPIKKLAVHPAGNLIAIYESDGFSIHQVSLWDWALKKNLFSKRLSDSVVSLSWSARGTYLFIGNRSTDGLTVLNTRGQVQKIYSEAPGIVFLSATANSEKNILTYGESGRLIYTEIKTRKKVKEFKTESFLQSTAVINNFKKLIGFKDKKVFVIDASSGKILEEYPANKAVFASKLQDTKPIWLERTKNRHEWRIRQGDTASQGFYLPKKSKITAARQIQNQMIVGAEDGSIYKITLNVDSTVKVEDGVKNSFEEIDDITSDGKILYALKEGDIYFLKSKDNNFEHIMLNLGVNRFTYFKEGFLLWSNEKRNMPLYHYSLIEKKLKKIAYPKESVISLSTYKDSVLFVESFKGATVVDFYSGKNLFSYNAPGIQNAVQIDSENIILSKSSTDKTQSPVFIVNTKTQETLPVPIEGSLAFSLKQNETRADDLNCFLIGGKTENKTELLRIKLNRENLGNSNFKAVLAYDEEDLDAFLIADGYDLLSNLGKSSLIYYNILSQKVMRLMRYYSLPKKAVILKDYFVSQNYGGTISWYDRKTKMLLKTHGIKEEKNKKGTN